MFEKAIGANAPCAVQPFSSRRAVMNPLRVGQLRPDAFRPSMNVSADSHPM